MMRPGRLFFPGCIIFRTVLLEVSITPAQRAEEATLASRVPKLVTMTSTSANLSRPSREWNDWDALGKEAVAFTQDLIRIPSVNTGEPDVGDGEDQCIHYIAGKLADVGIQGDYLASRPGRGNYRIVIPGDDPHALLIHSHVDVVPINADDWDHPPFGGDIIDGWIWGRGAVDMKDFAGMMLAVARHYALTGVCPARTLMMVWFSDEEHDGVWGSHWFVDHHPEWFAGVTQALSEVGGFSVTLPDHPDTRIYPLAVAEKGVAWARLSAKGRAGHGSRPSGTNAVSVITRAVAAIARHDFPIVHTPALDAFLDTITEVTGERYQDDELDAATHKWGFLGPVVRASLRNTAAPTQLHAGYAVNVIPADARATIDCRVLPGHEAEFFDTVEELLRNELGEDYDALTIHWEKPNAVSSDPQSPFVDTVREAITTIDPAGVVAPYLLPAGTDNKFLQRLGIECFGFVPLQVPSTYDCFGHFHAKNERVPVSAVHSGAQVLAHLTQNA